MLHGFSFLFVVESAWGEGKDGQNDKFVADETERSDRAAYKSTYSVVINCITVILYGMIAHDGQIL